MIQPQPQDGDFEKTCPAPQRVLVLGSYSRSLINFRGPLLKELSARGHQVVAAAPADEHAAEVDSKLNDCGVRFLPVRISRGSVNPIGDCVSLQAVRNLIRVAEPDVLIAYTVKPVVYGGMAVRAVHGVRFFPIITGVGYALTDGKGLRRALLRRMVTSLYRRGLKAAEKVFFQNPDDQRLFEELGLIDDPRRSIQVAGSGVSLAEFPPQSLPSEPVFLMLSRLVADKGVREYVLAARQIRQRFPDARFLLAGGLDPNPSGISRSELQGWVAAGDIEYLGDVHPVQPVLARCRFYVLPSYREGTPRSVLEAMATGRPVITTDAPGCRETVVNNRNGLLVPARDVDALRCAMELLLNYPDRAACMGQQSLEIVRAIFDVAKVNASMIEAMGL